MRIEQTPKLGFKDVLIRPKRSRLQSRSEVTLHRQFVMPHANTTIDVVPIIAANMDTTGTTEMADSFASMDMLVALHKYYDNKDIVGRFKGDLSAQNSFFTVGITDNDKARFDDFMQQLRDVTGVQHPQCYVCVDVANGYTERFVDFIKQLRHENPNIVMMAGNVVTGEMTEQLILAGADIVKVGIGSGSVCTTRSMTGVGYPQLSAVIECADAAHGLKGHVCSDGGCQVPGDIAKALGAGADFVMLGGMLAGHDESGGQLQEVADKDGNVQKVKRFYGMSSQEAMHNYSGGVAEYRASEGKSVDIPYRGPVKWTIQNILGGLRSGCTYVGAQKLKELSKCTTFVLVNEQLNEIYSPYNVSDDF